ncbi:MAG TPA: hypothetical protein VH853_10780 [Polyangia bacterium]|nr:hypothetical protein [Polyangia bacterium]
MSDKLSRAEVDFVLRRAAEIDTQSPARTEQDSSEALSVGEIVRLGEEVGLPRPAVEQALAEMRRGAPIEPEEQGALTRALGASRVVVSRVVKAPIETVRRAVDRFLREQLMTVRRHHGDRVEWERAQGLWPGLVRSLDFSKRYAFALVTRVETILSQEEGPDGSETAVTFNIDLSDMRRERFGQMGMRAAMAFLLFGVGGALMAPGSAVYDIVALAGGGVAAGGIFALERRRYLESRSRVSLAPERFLDLLSVRHRRPALPAHAPSASSSDASGSSDDE